MQVVIDLPAPLREQADGLRRVPVDAATVGEALRALTARFPRLRRHLFDEGGRLRGYVNVYVNEDAVAVGVPDADPPLAPGDTVLIVPSVAGG